MTEAGAPQGDDTGLQQEAIWAEPPDAASTPASAPAPPSRGLTQSITSTARTPGPGGLMLADVPNRIMALVIDIIALSVIGFAFAWLFGGLVSEAGALDSAGSELDILAFLLVLVLQLAVSFGYFTGTWVLSSATPGMRLLGLRVGDESRGRPLDWRPATLRWLLLGVPSVMVSLVFYVPHAVGVILAVLGAAWLLLLLYSMAQSPTRQGLHDRVAGSIVVRIRRRAA